MSAPAPARPTPRSGIPASTPSRARWRAGCCAAATRCSTTIVDEAGIAVERLGAVLVAWTDEQLQALPGILERAQLNGVTDVQLLSAEELYRREPHLNAGALGGLYVPGESIFCPFTLPLALATQAVLNGVTLKLNHPVAQISTDTSETYALRGIGGGMCCRYVVNAAGLYADQIDHLFGHADFTITPRRGELIVFDKLARSLVNHILLPLPTRPWVASSCV